MKALCRHCKHWEYNQEDPKNGTCHRFPPQLRHDGEFRFPIVSAGDHCGEFQWGGNS